MSFPDTQAAGGILSKLSFMYLLPPVSFKVSANTSKRKRLAGFNI
jgi:hypothetical protein